MSAPRANEVTEDERRAGEEVIAEARAIRAEIATANPDMSDDDWVRFGDEWSNTVDDGLRRHVRRLRGESDPITR